MSISGISGAGSAWSVNAANTSVTVTTAQQSGPFANLGLTQSQQQQISQILQSAQSQGLSPSQVQSRINAVLTPAQQQQLQNEINQHRHHHHHGSNSASSSVGQDQTDAFGIPTSISAGSSSATQAISDIAASFWSQSQQQQSDNS